MLLSLLHLSKKIAFLCSQITVKVTFTFLVSEFFHSQINQKKLLSLLHFIINFTFSFPDQQKKLPSLAGRRVAAAGSSSTYEAATRRCRLGSGLGLGLSQASQSSSGRWMH